MKRRILSALAAVAIISLPFCALAQEEKTETITGDAKIDKKENPEKKETEEIVIRNKGKKDLNLKVEINGDKITVNGMPLEEFTDGEVSINKRKVRIQSHDNAMTFKLSDDMAFGDNFGNGWKTIADMKRPFLGVTTEESGEGAKITEIVKGSAAEKAGLKKDDIITKVNDEKITDAESLSDVIAAKKPNEAVTVYYLRNKKKANVKLNLGERKMTGNMNFNYTAPNIKLRKFTAPRVQGLPGNAELLNQERLFELDNLQPFSGFNTAPPAFARQQKLGLKIQDTEEGGNVKVIDVETGSAAEKAGLKKDDIITEIGGVKIENTDDAREQLTSSAKKSLYNIKAKRDNKAMDFEVKIPKKLKTADL